jgi:hypothetical protein
VRTVAILINMRVTSFGCTWEEALGVLRATAHSHGVSLFPVSPENAAAATGAAHLWCLAHETTRLQATGMQHETVQALVSIVLCAGGHPPQPLVEDTETYAQVTTLDTAHIPASALREVEETYARVAPLGETALNTCEELLRADTSRQGARYYAAWLGMSEPRSQRSETKNTRVKESDSDTTQLR